MNNLSEIYFNIPTTNPKVIVTKSLLSSDLLKSGLSLLATPFFFNVKSLNLLNIQWSINRNKIQGNNQSFNLSINNKNNLKLNGGIGVGVLVMNKSIYQKGVEKLYAIL